ncbi:MAG: type I-A CRISPR-associated protein Cas4/Csa1 [Methanocellales archaeon]|nr:type I-A CRISPR-associated protein Cas4/Csa1 [Methanocellales archaeon]
MYFLSDVDHKLLVNKLLPTSREVGISLELRGWSWSSAPLKPYYDDVKIPMYLACSKYCPNNRDVFLNRVQGKRGEINFNVSQGIGLHIAVGRVMGDFIEGKGVPFEDWWAENYTKISNKDWVEPMKKHASLAWEFALTNCKAALANKMSEQPYASDRDTMATALPFLIEHKLNGELVGLSGLLSIDCYDYLHNIVFDLKIADKQEEWHKLYPTGYAVVIESIYEIPVDVGCTVYLSFKDDRLIVKRELFFINDDLRSWWLDERDQKLEIVAQRKDPGIPSKCYEDCIYWKECRD